MLHYPQEEPSFAVALSTSLVLFGFDGNDLQVLLAKSKRAPYDGALFLPSRYLNEKRGADAISPEDVQAAVWI